MQTVYVLSWAMSYFWCSIYLSVMWPCPISSLKVTRSLLAVCSEALTPALWTRCALIRGWGLCGDFWWPAGLQQFLFMVERVKIPRQCNPSDNHFHSACGITKANAVKTAVPWGVPMTKSGRRALRCVFWWLQGGCGVCVFVMPLRGHCWSGGCSSKSINSKAVWTF